MTTAPARAVVLDFDGTILDTEWSEYVTVRAEFEAHGLELPITQWQTIVGRADHPHWTLMLRDALGQDYDMETVKERRRREHHALIAEERIRPGIEALLDRADAASVPVAVASSSPRSWIHDHLERLGLLPRFVGLCSRDDVDRAKPWPDLYLAACGLLGTAPADAVAVEDSHHGCTAAKSAGLRCVVVPNRVTAGQDFGHADAVLDSLADAGPGLAGLP